MILDCSSTFLNIFLWAAAVTINVILVRDMMYALFAPMENQGTRIKISLSIALSISFLMASISANESTKVGYSYA